MKRALVTGARSGVGFELTKRLLADGYHVTTLTRSPLPPDEELREAASSDRLSSVLGDLSEARSRTAALDAIVDARDRLDLVCNVAGVSLGAPVMTAQGRESHFEVNTLAPFVVLSKVRPLLERSEDALVVNVSSNAALTVRSFDPGSLERPTTFKKLFGPYAVSKLALSMWTHAIAEELAASRIRIVSVCPGANRTPMTAGDGMPWWLAMLRPIAFRHPRSGAETVSHVIANRAAGAGEFVVKRKPTPIPFVERAPEVLAIVDRAARG